MPPIDGTEDDGVGMVITDLSGDTDFGSVEGENSEVSLDDVSAATDDLSGQEPSQEDLAQTAQQNAQGQQPQVPPQVPPVPPVQPQIPGQQQQPAPGSQQQPPSPQQAADFESYVRQNHDQLVSQLASGPFALSDEDVEAVQSDPKTAIPKLFARSYLTTAVQMQQALASSLPGVVGRLIQVSRDASANEEKFFAEYPGLKSVPMAQVASIAHTLRQNNPSLSPDEFRPLLARTVAAMSNVQLPPVQGRAQPPMPQAAAAQRGMAPQRGQAQIVDPLYDINNALRNGD